MADEKINTGSNASEKAGAGEKKDAKTEVKEEKTEIKDEKAAKTDEKPAEKADKPVKSGDKEKKELLDDDEDEGDLILEDERESIPLNNANARFFRSEGGLISLELTNEKGEKEMFERVIVLRAFPISNPTEFLSVREPDSRKMGRGKEIGMIRHMSDFDEETQTLFNEELDRRYFSPQLKKITSVKEKFGYMYWDAETSSGHVTFIMNNPFSNIRVLEDGRIIISDIDGNIFEIPDPKQLDSQSYKKIEIYL